MNIYGEMRTTILKAAHLKYPGVASKKACVQYVLASLVLVLWADKNYKFMNVGETFLRWWRDRCEVFYSVAKHLVSLDSLELINGVQACLLKAQKQAFDAKPQAKLFKETELSVV